jgi:hypothetical protein
MQEATPTEELGYSETSLDFLKGYVSEVEYARKRSISLRTAQRDRALRQSPPYVLIGKRVYYRVSAIREWLLEREQRNERRPAAPRAGKHR